LKGKKERGGAHAHHLRQSRFFKERPRAFKSQKKKKKDLDREGREGEEDGARVRLLSARDTDEKGRRKEGRLKKGRGGGKGTLLYSRTFYLSLRAGSSTGRHVRIRGRGEEKSNNTKEKEGEKERGDVPPEERKQSGKGEGVLHARQQIFRLYGGGKEGGKNGEGEREKKTEHAAPSYLHLHLFAAVDKVSRRRREKAGRRGGGGGRR